MTCEHVIENHPQGKQVGPCIYPFIGQLLGGHERRASQNLPKQGHIVLVQFCDTEISNFRMSVWSDKNIRRLDVAMHYPLAVSVVEGFCNLLNQAKRGAERQSAILSTHELL